MSKYAFNGNGWVKYDPVIDIDGNETVKEMPVVVANVPVEYLLVEWEDLVFELSEKETRLIHLKEYIQSQSFHIETTFDFKEAYGKNNADIRRHHIQVELMEVFEEVRDLELSIGWIKQYIPLLRECIRVKHDSTPHINSPAPIVLDGSHMTGDDVKRIRKALEEMKQ